MTKEEKDAIFSVSHFLVRTTSDKGIEYARGKITIEELNFWAKSCKNYLDYEHDIFLKFGY